MAAGLTVAACGSDEIVPEGNNNDGTTPAELSKFAGTIDGSLEIMDNEGCDGEQAEESTRSTISGGVFSSWSTEDVVSISDGTLFYKYKPTAINGTTCSFEVVDGSSQFDKNLTGDENFHVFYPAAAVTGWNGSVVTSQIYAQQDYTENADNGIMGAYMATKGTVTDDGNVSFSFKHCCSVVEVNLSTLGVTPKRVSLKTNSGESIAGKIAYDIDSKNITVTSSDATGYSYSTMSDVITLENIAEGAAIARFYILPVYIAQGVTVTVEDTNGNLYTKSTSTAIGTATEDISISESGGTKLNPATPYYKKVNFGAATTATRKGDWMAMLPGNVWLHTLSIPGAHDAATWKTTGAAQCQSKTIVEQLEAGVRAFDFRVPYKGISNAPTTATVTLYHGSVNTNVLFKDAMDYLVSFVKNHPTETAVVLINKENASLFNTGTDYSEDENSCTWQKSIRDYVDGTYTETSAVDETITGSRAGYFITDVNQPMRLSACRGKILFLSRNYYGTTQSATTPVYGGVIRTWQDNAAFDATFYKDKESGVCGVHVQDCYNQSNTTNKQNDVKTCIEASANDNNNVFYINFVSMVSGTLSQPKSYAPTMNQYTADLLGSYTGKTGIMFYDFCGDRTCNGDALQKAIINQNYKYLFKNRTRLSASSGNDTGADIKGDEFADDSEVFAKPYYGF